MKYLFLFFFCGSIYAQRPIFSSENAYASFGIGTTSYFGEMSPYRTFYKGIFGTMRSNFNFSLGKDANEHWGEKIDFSINNLRGDDFSYGKTSNTTLLSRNLHFKNTAIELSASKMYFFNPNYGFQTRRRPDFIAYASFGFGLFYHNPKARDVIKSNGELGDWVKLHKLGVAGVKYSLVQPVLPIGFGLRKKLSDHLDIKFEGYYKFTFTDYLDDVANEPYLTSANSFTSDQAFRLHNRSTEPFEALHGNNRISVLEQNGLLESGKIVNETGNRGVKNFFSSVDSFITSNVSLVFWLDPRMR